MGFENHCWLCSLRNRLAGFPRARLYLHLSKAGGLTSDRGALAVLPVLHCRLCVGTRSGVPLLSFPSADSSLTGNLVSASESHRVFTYSLCS